MKDALTDYKSQFNKLGDTVKHMHHKNVKKEYLHHQLIIGNQSLIVSKKNFQK